MSDRFFVQYPTPINTSEIGFDILGLKEVLVPPGRFQTKTFTVKKSLTVSDIMDYFQKICADQNKTLQENGFAAIAYLKERKVIEATEELREIVLKEFSDDIKKFSGNVVQFVETPVCILDLAPGNTAIGFNVFTKRCLGNSEELENETA